MIKFEQVGQMDIAKINPELTSENDVMNNSFIVDNGVTYLILNDIHGDDAYKDAVVIKAGEYLNGYDVSVYNGQKLLIDEKHIAYAEGKSYADLTVGTMLKVATTGKLEVTAAAPASGVYFVVTDKITLTEKAVKARVVVC